MLRLSNQFPRVSNLKAVTDLKLILVGRQGLNPGPLEPQTEFYDKLSIFNCLESLGSARATENCSLSFARKEPLIRMARSTQRTESDGNKTDSD